MSQKEKMVTLQEMAVSWKWLHLFFSFEQQSKPRGCKMTNRDPCYLPAAFSMLKKNGIPPGNGCVLEKDASFFLFHKANQEVEQLPIETHEICQLPSLCRKNGIPPRTGCILEVVTDIFFSIKDPLLHNKANQEVEK